MNRVLRYVPEAWSDVAGFDRRLWVLYAGFVVSAMGFAMVVPFVSLYFHEELGVSMSVVGLFFLATAVVRGAFQGYAGELSDRIGRKGIMVGGQILRGVAFGGMALAVHWRLAFLPAAGILILSYIAGSFYQPVASAAVSDLAPPERRVQAYALMRVANNLGWGIGPMLGGLVSEIDYAWLFLLGGITSVGSAWFLARHLSETHEPGAMPGGVSGGPPGKPRSHALSAWSWLTEIHRDRRFLGFCLWSVFLFLAMSQWLATLSVYASDHLKTGRGELGLMFGLNGLMVVVFQLPVTRALRRLSLGGSLVLGSLVYATFYLALAFAGSYGYLLACMVGITLAELIATPPATVLASLMAPPGRLGRYMGLFGLTTSFGWSVGPALGGGLLDLWGNRPLLLWGSVAALDVVAAAGFWGSRRRYPRGDGPSRARD
jgi:MFS family permease